MLLLVLVLMVIAAVIIITSSTVAAAATGQRRGGRGHRLGADENRELDEHLQELRLVLQVRERSTGRAVAGTDTSTGRPLDVAVELVLRDAETAGLISAVDEPHEQTAALEVREALDRRKTHLQWPEARHWEPFTRHTFQLVLLLPLLGPAVQTYDLVYERQKNS